MTTETLSQVGLAVRFRCSAYMIRQQGEYVTMQIEDGRRETWARYEYSSGRLAGYHFVSSSPPRTVAERRYGDDHPEWTAKPDITPESHPEHHTVGKEFMGPHPDFVGPATRWFCESHDAQGYWLYATDGSGRWAGVSERAIGRTYHEIHEFDGRLLCSYSRVPPYVAITAGKLGT